MADPNKSDDEFGRRLAAARGYSRIPSAEEWAKRLGVDRGTLRRYERLGSVDPLRRAGVIERCIEETGLPAEFFAIDLKDLPEMVAAWKRVQAEASTPEGLVEEQEKDEGEQLPPDPNESPSEEQGP